MSRYDIWWANVRFEDSEEIKQRPVLIWGEYAYIVAFKMTSVDRGDDRDEYSIKYWREAGLNKPTSIRIKKVLKLTKTDLVSKIGELDFRDRLMFECRIAG